MLYSFIVTAIAVFMTLQPIIHVIVFHHRLLCPLTGFPVTENVTRVALLADPQMEGNTRLLREGPLVGQLNLDFNDWFLSHLYSQFFPTALPYLIRPLFSPFYTPPDIVIWLGDIFSFQHMSHEEWENRVTRLKSIIERTDRLQTRPPKHLYVAGNHDIGYSEDMTRAHIHRFEQVFQTVNGDAQIYGKTFSWINSMVLDGIPTDPSLGFDTWQFINNTNIKNGVLLSHVPLFKEGGKCPGDRPEFIPGMGQSLRSQTLLSSSTTQKLLSLEPRWILSGHDHEGCYGMHLNETFYPISDSVIRRKHGMPGIIDITLRSCMAEFGGMVGYLTLGEEEDIFVQCPFINHVLMWIVIGADIVWILFTLISIPFLYQRQFQMKQATARMTKIKQT